MIKKTLGLLAGMICCISALSGAFGSSVDADLTKGDGVYLKNDNTVELYAAKPETVNLKETDSSVSFSILTSTRSSICQSYSYRIKTATSNYFLGYYGEGDEYLPLTFTYDVTKADNTVENRTTVMSLQASNQKYDSVGTDLAGRTQFDSTADLPIGADEELDVNSIEIYNIFAMIDENTLSPQFNTNYLLNAPKLATAAKTNYQFEDFMSVSYNGISSFAGYSSISCEYSSMAKEVYKTAFAKYASHEEAVNDGSEYINVRFGALTSTYYNVVLNDGTFYKKQILGSTVLHISDEGKFEFLLNGFNSGDVDSFQLLSGTLIIDLVNSETQKVVVGSALSYRFGAIPFFKSATSFKTTNYNMILIFVTLGYIVLFAAADYGYYRYKKEKYKNDEFNRVIPREFLNKSLLCFAYLGLWIEEIIVLIGRTTSMKNSLIVFNPFDAYITAFSVILIVFTGYYIKYFLGKFKDYKAKKMEIRLKLNDTVEDDGTGNVK